MRQYKRHFKTCKYCNQSGFVWYRDESTGRFHLAQPIPGTMQPDPSKLHHCAQRTPEAEQQEGEQPTEEVRLCCRGCGMVITTQRRFLHSSGLPICPKDEQFFEEGVPLEQMAL